MYIQKYACCSILNNYFWLKTHDLIIAISGTWLVSVRFGIVGRGPVLIHFLMLSNKMGGKGISSLSQHLPMPLQHEMDAKTSLAVTCSPRP